MKVKFILTKYISKKRLIVLSSFLILVTLLTLLNYTFSAFTNRSENKITNIKVSGMEYNLTINGIPGTTIIANKNNITKSNIIITSLNSVDSKYELIYRICSDETCKNFINKPEGINIEYSSKTTDFVTGAIVSSGNKNIRIITTNNTNDTYYIKLDLNAGYIHNTLALQNLIKTEYNEEDIIIATLIDGEISTTFPTVQGDYITTVTCTTNNGPSNAIGTVSWNGFKWILNVTGIDSGRTICNVEFIGPRLKEKILEQYNGADAIIARGTPNFGAIAPEIINYKESTSNYTSSLSGNNNRTIATSYTFNELTGRYTLKNYVTGQSYGEQHIGHYTCNSTSYSLCSTIYKINEVNGTSVTNSTQYLSEINEYNYDDTGIFAAEDEYGTSYYYRGYRETLNNNLIWGGFQWKIIRINGDGSVRLIYNGTEEQFNANGTMNVNSNVLISSGTYNSPNRNDAKYVGYMYGGANGEVSTIRNGATSLAATYNQTSSNLKNILDEWYQNNILNKSSENQVVNNLFCNDRQFANEVGGTNSGPGYGNSARTDYAARYRVVTIKTPTLKCNLKNDRFTTPEDITIGNGALTYPIATITIDEASMAGMVSGINNSTNFLFGTGIWIMSPNYAEVNDARIFRIDSSGNFSDVSVNNSRGIRPVISISGEITVTGDGSSTNPFRTT